MENKSWRGTRFKKKPHPKADEFLRSIDFDKELLEYDIVSGIAHAKMLGKCGIIENKESAKLVRGLESLLARFKKGKIKIDSSMEDVHVLVTDSLKKEIGEVAEKLHTARSRNDQVALDMKMYCKDKIQLTAGLVKAFQKSILAFAKKNIGTIVPGYTHLQQAQFVSVAHYLLAFVEMLERDKKRLANAYSILDELPLGSCALSGTSLPIDRAYVAKLLGFSKVSKNSIDAVSDRDFILEVLGDLAILGMHLSRLSEDFIILSTKEFDIIDIDESFCTGSSIMPHKKNADVLEYVRGYTGRLYGNLVSLLVTMKGLPLSYNRDMQHDKEPLFSSMKIAGEMLEVLAELFKALTVKKNKIEDPGLYSVDIAEYLVKKGESYEKAHNITGGLINYVYKKNIKKIDRSSLPLDVLKSFSGKFEKNIYDITFDSKKSMNLKKSYGGTSINNVMSKIKQWEKLI